MRLAIARLGPIVAIGSLIFSACGGTQSASPTSSAAVVAPTAAAQTSSAAAGSKFDELLKAAQAEMTKNGGVLRISQNSPPAEWKFTEEAFLKDFPFVKKLEHKYTTGAEQFQAETLQLLSSNPPILDVSHPGAENRDEWNTKGLAVKPPIPYADLAKSLPSGWPALDPRAYGDEAGRYLFAYAQVRGITYNKDVVPANLVPKTWEDLLKPAWKGKVTIDPRLKFSAFFYDTSARDWFLKDYMPKLAPSVVLVRVNEAVSAVASGQYWAAAGMNYYQSARETANGAPLAFVVPDPYLTEMSLDLAVTKTAQSPNTGALFILWQATRGQEAMAKQFKEFPWYPNGTQYPLVQGKQKMILCDNKCTDKTDEYQRDWNRLLGIPN